MKWCEQFLKYLQDNILDNIFETMYYKMHWDHIENQGTVNKFQRQLPITIFKKKTFLRDKQLNQHFIHNIYFMSDQNSDDYKLQ